MCLLQSGKRKADRGCWRPTKPHGTRRAREQALVHSILEVLVGEGVGDLETRGLSGYVHERNLFRFQQVINSQDSLPQREWRVSIESTSTEVSGKFMVGCSPCRVSHDPVTLPPGRTSSIWQDLKKNSVPLGLGFWPVQ